MSLIPLGKGSHERLGLPESRLVNMLYEQDPTNQEDQTALIQRWGVEAFKTCGSGPIRGVYQENTAQNMGAYKFVVSGTDLYKITSGGTVSSIGTVSGSVTCEMASGSGYVVITNGSTSYYTDGFTVSGLALPGGIGADCVGFLAGYFLVGKTASQRVYFSAVGGITFASLDYFEAEFSPDYLLAIKTIGDYAFLCGENSIEVHAPTGNADAPFRRVTGSTCPIGIVSRNAVVTLDNSLFFVGNDRCAYRLSGGPQKISDSAIDAKLRAATTFASWACQMDGHSLWIIYTGTESLVYDATTNQWSKFKTYGLDYFRLTNGWQHNADVFGADVSSGQIWKMNPSLSTDNGAAMVREWSGAIDTPATARCDNVILDCTVGTATLDDDPQVELRVSDDWNNWTSWIGTALGRSGDYLQRVVWRRLGLIRRPGRLFQWRTSANCEVTVRKARLNERV